MSRLISSVVDWLPRRLWTPGNLRVDQRLHFCYSGAGGSVRTVEWRGREVAVGSRVRDDELA
jgi:hypothetical protein